MKSRTTGKMMTFPHVAALGAFLLLPHHPASRASSVRLAVDGGTDANPEPTTAPLQSRPVEAVPSPATDRERPPLWTTTSTGRMQERPWTTTDTVVNAGLFFLLHTIVWSSAQLCGFSPVDAGDRWAFAIARLISISSFVALQQAAPGGLSLDEWRVLPSVNPLAAPTPPPLRANLLLGRPVIAALAFSTVSLFSSIAFGALASGLSTTPSSMADLAWLPAPRPLEAGRALDLLIGAPIQEELIFRGWLLAALRRNGVKDAAAIAFASLLFTVWHIDAINGNALLRGGDGGGLVQLFGLGSWLGFLYTREGRSSLLLPIGTHSAYNGIILLLEACRVG